MVAVAGEKILMIMPTLGLKIEAVSPYSPQVTTLSLSYRTSGLLPQPLYRALLLDNYSSACMCFLLYNAIGSNRLVSITKFLLIIVTSNRSKGIQDG